MFSGIIERKEKAKSVENGKDFKRIRLAIPSGWKVTLGESINIDGICSTVENIKGKTFSVYYMPETLRKTNLSKASPTHTFNLEKCLTLQTLIGGHLVSGHVDTTATVSKIEQEGEARILHFKIRPQFTRYIIYKGSICVNGVSLTIVTVTSNSFSVSLIPHTLKHTNLGELKVGDTVNIEVDLVAKYLGKLQRK